MSTPSETSGVRRSLKSASDPSLPRRGLHLPAQVLGWLAPPRARPAAVVAEVLLLPLLAVALGYVWTPGDPLGSQGPFPWSWLAAVVLALRYGAIAGLGGACVLLVAWLAFNAGQQAAVFPQLFFLGGLILVMLVGEFSSLWRARTRRAETLQLYLDQRLEHLVRQHYLLRLSHDRLEQELIGRPMSMRDALPLLRDTAHAQDAPEQSARTLLQLLAQYCQLEAATLHAVADDHVAPQAMAQVGAHVEVDAHDALVRQALQTRTLCHISQAQSARLESRYLVAAPLLDLAGETRGLLVVHDMPFFALQTENLQTLQLLLQYYTDGLSMQALAAPIVQRFPDCPALFAFELQRLSHIQTQSQVPSVVVVLEFHERAMQQGLAQQIERLKRELDDTWLVQAPQRQALAVLMPLGDASTAEGYLHRIEGWMQQRSGKSLEQAGVYAHVVPLDGSGALRTAERIQAIAHAQP